MLFKVLNKDGEEDYLAVTTHTQAFHRAEVNSWLEQSRYGWHRVISASDYLNLALDGRVVEMGPFLYHYSLGQTPKDD